MNRVAHSAIRRVVAALLLCCAPLMGASNDSVGATPPPPDAPTVIVVLGAYGEPQYGREFEAAARSWRDAATTGKASFIQIGLGEPTSDGTSDYDQFKQALAGEAKVGLSELWIVLVGHGTFDGKVSKFNLRGPDLGAADLATWLKPFKRPLVVVDTSSASAPFLAALSAPNRAVVTSTRSGFEQNYSRFGRFFAEALTDAKSDLDRDGQVSLLEAFLIGARHTGEFYKTAGRLATEHALIDDNGDGLGTPSDWFRGVRATKRARDNAELDGTRARQLCLVRSASEQNLSPTVRARRDEIELQIEKLRDTKSKIPEEEYYQRLEALMLTLAAVYEDT